MAKEQYFGLLGNTTLFDIISITSFTLLKYNFVGYSISFLNTTEYISVLLVLCVWDIHSQPLLETVTDRIASNDSVDLKRKSFHFE